METRLSSRRRRLQDQTSVQSVESSVDHDRTPNKNKDASFVTDELSSPIRDNLQETNNSLLTVENFLEFVKISPQKASTPNPSENNRLKKIVEVNSTSTGFYDSALNEQSRESISTDSFVHATKFFASQSTREDIPSDYFSGGDTPRKLRESTRRLTLRKPHNSYIAYSSDEELDEWWEQPKTDYTYSASLTYRECITPERQILSPNMSRRGMRGNKLPHLKSPPFTWNLERTASANSLALRSREVPRGSYSNFSDESEDEVDRLRENRSFTTHINQESSNFSKRYISHGLDEEEDEGGQFSSSTPLDHFAKPLVRKGATSLVRGPTTQRYSQGSPIPYNPNESYLGSPSNGTYRANSHQHIHRWRDTLHSCATTFQSSIFLLFMSIYTWIYTTTLNTTSRIRRYLIPSRSHRVRDFTFKEREPLSRKAWSLTKAAFTTITTTFITTTTTIITTTTTIATTIRTSTIDRIRRMSRSYVTHRRQNPWLWSWLPLLILLLLTLLFFGAYLWRRIDQPERPVLPTSTLEAPATLKKNNTASNFYSFSDILSKINAALGWFASTLVSNFNHFWIFIRSFAISIFNHLADLFLHVIHILCSFLLYILSCLSNLLPNSESFFNVISNSTSVVHGGIYSGFQLVTSALSDVSTVMWDIAVTCSHFLYRILSSSGYAVLFCLNAVWNGIGVLFAPFLTLVSNIGAIVASSWSTLASKIYWLQPAIHSKNHETQFVTPKASDESSASIVGLVLQSEHFHSILSSTMERTMDQRTLSKDQIEHIIKEAVEKQVSSLNLQISDKDDIKLLEQINALKEQSDLLSQKVKEMSDSHGVEKDSRYQLSEMIDSISSTIKILSNKLNKVDSDHLQLMAQVKGCCHKSVSLEDVERHIKTIFSDLLPTEDEGTPAANIEPSRIGSWLRTYFVAKSELELALNNVTARFQSSVANESSSIRKSLDKTSEQSMDKLMDDILTKLREEIKLQNHQMKINLDDVSRATSEALKSIKNETSTSEKNLHDVVEAERLGLVLKGQLSQKELQDVGILAKQAIEGNLTMVIQQILSGTFPEDVSSLIAQVVKEEVRKIMTQRLKEKETASVTYGDTIKNILPQVVAEYFSSNKSVLKGLFENEFHNPGSGRTVHNGDFLGESYSIEGTTMLNQAPLFYGLNESTVQKIVQKALLKYDADKTGLVDHALESAGGSIVSTRCTEGYEVAHKVEWTIMGYPFYRFSTNDPRSVIQPGRMPGNCWAFKGSEGFLVIQLAAPVQLTGFSLEHIPKSLNPSGDIDSAPKDFSVYGLHALDFEGVHIGDFRYMPNEDPLQYFQAKNITDVFYPYVELKIRSNHGNLHYTCIYRFRVHGNREHTTRVST